MSVESRPQPEGLRMCDELIAVHTVMRRGAVLTAGALHRLADGDPLDVRALVRLARWQTDFVHHHYVGEDAEFWPVLRRLFPDSAASLDSLTVEHATLDCELRTLSAAVDQLADAQRLDRTEVRRAASTALPAADKVRDVLVFQFDTGEPVFQRLFPQVPDPDIRRIRAAIGATTRWNGLHLVFGLLEDPFPTEGSAAMLRMVPRRLRALRPLALKRYRALKTALGC
jgi:hypothetical protein